MAGFGHIAGGLLQGIGQGIQKAGAAKREAALEELRHQRAMQRDETRHQREIYRDDRNYGRDMERDETRWSRDQQLEGTRHGHAIEREDVDRRFRAGESAKTRAAEAGRLSNTERFTDADGRMWIRHADGSFEPAQAPDGSQLRGVPGGRRSSDDSGSFTAGDSRLWETVVQRHTRVDENGAERADWQAIAEEFRRQGRSDLAAMAAPAPGSVDTDDPRYRAAREQAEAEAEDRTSLWRSRSSEFPETRGGKVEWIDRRADEIYRGRSGQSSPAEPPALRSEPPRTPREAQGGRPAGQPQRYDSADAVRQAYRDGALTRLQAQKILREQFDYQ